MKTPPRRRYRIREYWWGLDLLYKVQFYGPHKTLVKTGLFRKEWVSSIGWYTIESGFDFLWEAEDCITQDRMCQS